MERAPRGEFSQRLAQDNRGYRVAEIPHLNNAADLNNLRSSPGDWLEAPKAPTQAASQSLLRDRRDFLAGLQSNYDLIEAWHKLADRIVRRVPSREWVPA